jgi:hypothetical protein
MIQDRNAETDFQRLKEMALTRFGEERTEVLTPAIREIATALAAVGRFRLREDEEPAFFR